MSVAQVQSASFLTEAKSVEFGIDGVQPLAQGRIVEGIIQVDAW
jgi:hypothetical protein